LCFCCYGKKRLNGKIVLENKKEAVETSPGRFAVTLSTLKRYYSRVTLCGKGILGGVLRTPRLCTLGKWDRIFHTGADSIGISTVSSESILCVDYMVNQAAWEYLDPISYDTVGNRVEN
jgi:hypothetical protein